MHSPKNLLILVAVLLALSLRLVANVPHNEPLPVEVELKPDPGQARPLDHWPTQADLDRLQSVKGRSPAATIRILGHPSAVGPGVDGSEVWDYPWLAACRVWFRNGVVIATFYTAGW
jgi:hypothetical protein